MDKNEDSEITAAHPGTAGDPADPAVTPPAGPAEASKPTLASKIELASTASPMLAPAMIELPAELPGLDAPKLERPIERAKERSAAAEKFEAIKPRSPEPAGPVAREIIAVAAAAAGRTSRKLSEFTLLAAAVVLAAAFGAMAGTLGASGVARLAGETATVEEPPGLQAALAQLRSEIAALKASVDATGRAAGAQYGKLVERFDRVERMQSVTNKTDAALPKETTGAVTPPSPAAAPLPPVPVPAAATVPGWAVRDVYRGVAMLRSRLGGMVEVEPGDVLPGLGRIEAIRRQDGRWVVITSKGMITSMR
jgi:hypothetical protein